MPRYVVMGMVFFEHASDVSWARGRAQWLVENSRVLAAQAALVDPGTVGERTSYMGSYEVQADGALLLVDGWHVAADGTVQPGLPNSEPAPPPDEEPEPPAAPAWAPGLAVTVGEVYTHQGTSYEVIQAHTTQVGWEPSAVPALWRRL